MPKKKSTAAERATRVPVREFLGKYANDIIEGEEADKRMKTSALTSLMSENFKPPRLLLSPNALWEEVRDWWPVRLLRKAAKENDSEGYKRVLQYWLLKLGIDPPKGVLAPWRGRSGRPREKEADQIVLKWVEIGRPSLSRQLLARAFYGNAFQKADGAEKKKMIDRCQKAVQRRLPSTEIPTRHRRNLPSD